MIIIGQVPSASGGFWVRFEAADGAAHQAALTASISLLRTTNREPWGSEAAGTLALVAVQRGDFPSLGWYLVPVAQLSPADAAQWNLHAGDWSQITRHAAIVDPPQSGHPHTRPGTLPSAGGHRSKRQAGSDEGDGP